MILSHRKGVVAQLMRVFVAVPDGPISVTICPLVQPAQLPCPLFHLGVEDGVVLQNNAVTVLRLPYPFY